ncbi:PAS domain S-box protein [Brunnivagina elsteri]|uniref:histidine kinase n=1 Tax=Brunnivagina elsteri CCALA 953 TaxID=987040 RepID=A0A2A2TC50_9CYAN|nr:PAS domain S-box protein [Calothrix elsteri]PAX51302.1 histidine kinase [Calothrix elsteri CCALA 953]
MKKLSFTKKLTAVFGVALAVIILNAVISTSNTIQLTYHQDWVMQSLRVITQLERTLSAFNHTEIATRGYLLTAEKSYLNDYNKGLEQTSENLRLLQTLALQESKTKKEIILLNYQISESFNSFEGEIKRRSILKKISPEPILALSDSTSDRINQIQQLTLKIKLGEQNLLQQRVNASNSSFRSTMTTFSIVTFGDVGLLGLLYVLLRKYITRLKLTEQRLMYSENRLRTIIDAEPECIQLISPDGTLLEINASGLSIMEVDTADELVGRYVGIRIAPEYLEEFFTLHKSVCQGIRGKLEFEIISCKGTRKWVESHAVPLPNEFDGTFLHLAVMRDVSERKLAEQKIREQAALLDIAVDGILVQNIQGQIQYWNKGAERVYGWSAGDAIGENVTKLLYKEDNSQLHHAIANVIESGSWQGELNQLRQDGREIIVESRWTLVVDGMGEPKSILMVNTDITQKKLLETQLLRSQRLESIGTLAGGIAHDLNNVLSPIMMSVQLLQMKLHDKEQQKLLKTLENNVKRGANLVKQVLSFATGIESKRTNVDFKQIFAEIAQIITETFPKQIIFQQDIDKNINRCCGDTTQIHQILMNLVVNARDAMPDGGKLTISLKNIEIERYDTQINFHPREGNYILITVTDSGIGMPPDIQERIFEPFFTTKEVGKGTGLGLSTVLSIIKNHDGFIDVDSKVGEYTSFKVYLPAKEIKQPLSQILPEIEMMAGDGEVILVVDDEAAIRKITQSTLEACNYKVLTASDGREAVATYTKYHQDISIILLDMMMPSMDGEKAIRALKNINPQVKIIAISGLVFSHKTTQVREMGVEAFLSKPCTASELLQAISTVNS